MSVFRTEPVILICLAASVTSAADWPCWRGPEHNGISAETRWLDGWAADHAPTVAWRAQVGKGHSAVVVSAGRAFTMGWDGKQDTVWCLDAATGQVVWKHPYPCETIYEWPGPRSTPAVHDGVVYTLSHHGLLHALDAVSGNVRWKVQLGAGYVPSEPYGFAWSPLVIDDLLILGAGSRGLALRTKDGSFAWGNDSKPGTCVSAVLHRWQGATAVATVRLAADHNSATLVGSDPSTGKGLWQWGPWPEKWGAMGADLIIHDGKVLVTSAQEHKSTARLSPRDGRLQRDWETNQWFCYSGSPVLIGQHLYAATAKGDLICADWESGKIRWSKGGFGLYGALIAADGKLIVQGSGSGDMVIADAQAESYREMRRFRVFTGRRETYTTPTLANGRIYCRSYHGEVVCLKTTGGQ